MKSRRIFTARGLRRRGFTMIEVLATVLLIAIVMPAIMDGVTYATAAGAATSKRSQAAALAEEKLNEILAGQLWESGSLSGNFAPDQPDMQWHVTLQNWQYDTTDAGLQELDLTVNWPWRNQQQSLQLSTIVYVRDQANGSTSSQ